MKKHHHHNHTNRTKPYPTEEIGTKNQETDCGGDLDQVAEELVELARRRLPDGVLRGSIEGDEEDIRQDAVLLSLSWYLRGKLDPANNTKYPWIAPRAIAEALRIQKRDYLKSHQKENEAMLSLSEGGSTRPHHPATRRSFEWSASAMEMVLLEALRIALKSGRISEANAAITKEVIIEGVLVSELAQRLKVHRSAISQRLSRVKRAIPDIIDGIEVPLTMAF